VSGLILGVRLYLTLEGSMGIEILFPLLFGPLFFGGGLVLVWAAAETAVRETWREKIVSLDLIVNGHPVHSRVGIGVVRGTAFGIASVALVHATTYAMGQFVDISLASREGEYYQTLASASPFVSSLMESFYVHSYTVAFVVMFLAARIGRTFSSRAVVFAVVTAVLASLHVMTYTPVWSGAVIAIVGCALTVAALIRFDVLTAFVTLTTSTFFRFTLMLNASETDAFAASVIAAGLLFAAIVVFGVVTHLQKDELTEIESVTPAFAKHITERERLRHELSIARQVQMSFLPRANPEVSTLDIASRCAPALEVGGDYYDFLELPGGRLAVVVGDVSGKGTQAAFFMTLTKGFLRALAQSANSPGSMLKSVNRLFYENVDRGVFISLICGVFDTNRSTLTIARAGHNPVILKKTGGKDSQILNPMGLALGLDAGDVFERSIKEVTVRYEPGDVFVFYTDGVSEAMNRSSEEFGEDRLSQAVESHASKRAAGILDGVLADVQTFVGKAQQHDDVTMVVVKVMPHERLSAPRRSPGRRKARR
jgi:serine phosphatase RsbU (regulator of sigma subunit)